MSPVDIKNASSLAHLLPGKWLPAAVEEVTVTGVCMDHRRVETGDLFIAIPGARHDGRRFINDAIKAGASAVLMQADSAEQTIAWKEGVPIIPEVNLSQKLSGIAAHFYGDPSQVLKVVGITGTNGKTTCSHLLAQLEHALGQSAAVLGTLGYGLVSEHQNYFDQLIETGLTTTDAIATQVILAELRSKGTESLAMEVSSHALEQHRVADIKFQAAIFTNLTQDHLDYHGDMESYGRAKQRLFAFNSLRHRVVNVDDDFGRKLAAELGSGNAWTYSQQDPSASMFASNVVLSAEGIHADVRGHWGEGHLSAPLFGEFNLSNLLAVITTACAMGHSLDAVLKAAQTLHPVPGRMEPVIVEGGPRVIVDYAHTPDSLQRALLALRNHTQGKLYCVFGCGGDRDRGKRPLMAAAAEQLADEVIVTNDNPRTEDASVIFSDINSGFSASKNVLVIEDRAEAITQAIDGASAADCVLIAGKGHENYQLVGNNRLPFSDVKQARLALRARAAKQGAKS